MTVAAGTKVFAGTVNVTSPIRVLVEQTGESSRVAKILRQVEDSARRRAPVVQAASRITPWFVGGVLVLAAVTYVAWRSRDPARAMDNAIALLIVTCPCALALSTPLAVSAAIGRAARRGIFVKGGDALEALARPGRLFLDKTGTITEARTALVHWCGPEWAKPLVLALEAESTHPLAAGFRAAWPELDGAARERDDARHGWRDCGHRRRTPRGGRLAGVREGAREGVCRRAGVAHRAGAHAGARGGRWPVVAEARARRSGARTTPRGPSPGCGRAAGASR